MFKSIRSINHKAGFFACIDTTCLQLGIRAIQDKHLKRNQLLIEIELLIFFLGFYCLLSAYKDKSFNKYKIRYGFDLQEFSFSIDFLKNQLFVYIGPFYFAIKRK